MFLNCKAALGNFARLHDVIVAICCGEADAQQSERDATKADIHRLIAPPVSVAPRHLPTLRALEQWWQQCERLGAQIAGIDGGQRCIVGSKRVEYVPIVARHGVGRASAPRAIAIIVERMMR